MFATRVLEGFGHEVTALRSGEECVEFLKKGEWPEIIFLDWMMPGMDGLDVCRAIRATPDGGNVFIAVITSRALDSDRDESLAAGANMHIAKPARAEDMERAVKAAEDLYRQMGLGHPGAHPQALAQADDVERSG